MFEKLKLTPSKNTCIFTVVVKSEANFDVPLFKSTSITESDFEEWIPAIKFLDKLDGWGAYNFGCRASPVIPDELHVMLCDLIPTDADGDCHSINLSGIIYVGKDGKVFDVEML